MADNRFGLAYILHILIFSVAKKRATWLESIRPGARLTRKHRKGVNYLPKLLRPSSFVFAASSRIQFQFAITSDKHSETMSCECGDLQNEMKINEYTDIVCTICHKSDFSSDRIWFRINNVSKKKTSLLLWKKLQSTKTPKTAINTNLSCQNPSQYHAASNVVRMCKYILEYIDISAAHWQCADCVD